MSRRVRAGLVAWIVAGAVIGAPSPAAAADSCGLIDGTVTLTSDAGMFEIGSGSGEYGLYQIRIVQNGSALEFWRHDMSQGGYPEPIPCENSPTVSNTSAVNVTLTNTVFSQLVLDMSGGRFASPGSPTQVAFTIDQTAGELDGDLAVRSHSSGGRVTAGANGINLDGDADVDVTTSGTARAFFFGSDGSDTLSFAGGHGTGAPSALVGLALGGPGSDVLIGGPLDDSLTGGDGADVLYGGDGDDKLGMAGGFGDFDAGNDRLFGEGGNDTLRAGPGNDVMVGGAGADVFQGMGGIDTASYAGAVAGVRVSMDYSWNDGTFINLTSEGDFVDRDVENVTGSAFADRITGATGTAGIRNVLAGGGGSDVLSGLDGHDVLNGGGGTNTLYGGVGADTMIGGAARDIMSGGPGSDTVKGGGGNDSLAGNDGNDVLYGQDGNDSINGGANTDTCYGGRGTNTVRNCERP